VNTIPKLMNTHGELELVKDFDSWLETYDPGDETIDTIEAMVEHGKEQSFLQGMQTAVQLVFDGPNPDCVGGLRIELTGGMDTRYSDITGKWKPVTTGCSSGPDATVQSAMAAFWNEGIKYVLELIEDFGYDVGEVKQQLIELCKQTDTCGEGGCGSCPSAS